MPTPITVGEDRIFFSGGYDTGSCMLRLSERGGAIVPEELFRLKPTVFGADQHKRPSFIRITFTASSPAANSPA